MTATMSVSSQAAPTGVHVGAFFDVDNTLIPGCAVEVRFFRFLWRRGVVGLREARESVRHLLRCMPPLSLRPLRERKLYLAGKRVSDIESLAEAFVQETIPRDLASKGLLALRRHQDAGHRLVLITGSMEFLVAPLARHLRVECVLAGRPEQQNGIYTGHLIPPYPYGEGKRILVESFAQTHGLDLTKSFAYGDSPGDVEALRLVGYPLVVNPIRGMAKIAKRHGWQVEKWA